jgi:endonuclease YncB( thermonuclease family)
VVAATIAGAGPAGGAPGGPARAVVVGVQGGDRLVVRLASGRLERVAVLGIAAPAAGACAASAAAAETRRLTSGKHVALVADATGPARDGAGRLLAYVGLSGGLDLGRVLLDRGLAQIDAWGRPFGRFLAYVPVQRSAEAAARGIWRACAADVSVTVTAAPGRVAVGDRIAYTAVVRNRGPLTARGVALELRPSRASPLHSVASAAGPCVPRGWLATCSFASLPPGAAVTATLVAEAATAGPAWARGVARFPWCVRARCGATPLRDADTANDEQIGLKIVQGATASLDRRAAPATVRPVAAGPRGSAAARGPGPDLRELTGVEFVSVCGFSHRAPDDPIVHPGHAGLSHDHTFFGNVSTNASSTPGSLRTSQTTCQRSQDTAAYWVPTLIVDHRVVEPTDAVVYYRRRTIDRVRPFPAGLAVVAGDAHAAASQHPAVVFWDCGDGDPAPPTAAARSCPGSPGRTLRLNVRFPDCWDGRQVDSDDHASHMAYSSAGVCPASHRVAVASLTLVVQYPTAGGPGVQLASGGQLSAHADFVNAWQQSALTRLVDYCLNALRICGRSS